MLTPEEVQRSYESREPDLPYILEEEKEGKLLIFLGAVHSNDPAHPQWPQFESRWRHFVNHPNTKKTVFVEGHAELDEGATKEQALANGESPLAIWEARQAGIPVESPEPDRVKEIKHLQLNFSDAQVVTYYFGRQMLQWARQDRQLQPDTDWRDYAGILLGRLDESGCFAEGVNLENAMAWFKQVTGREFDSQEMETLYTVSDPYQSRVSAASGDYRDKFLLKRIEEELTKGNDLFIVYGSGHAIKLEASIKDLVSKNWGEL